MSEQPGGGGPPRRRAPRGAAGDLDALAGEVKIALVAQAIEDPEYRRLALRDPRAALRRNRFVGAKAGLVPAGLRFRVVEETPERLYLVVPSRPETRTLDPNNPKDVLLRKALGDPAYLDRLVADPRSVLEAEFLVEVPPGFEVTVLKETPRERIAVLPADLRPDQVERVPADVLQYQSSGWPGGGGDCSKTFLGSIIENLCRHYSEFVSPTCTTWEDQCQGVPGPVGPV